MAEKKSESLKFEVNRLCRNELEYELAVRNCAADGDASVDDLRKALRTAIKYAAETSMSASFIYPYSYDEDITAVTAGVAEIKGIVDRVSGTPSGNEYKKVRSKIAHYLGRVSRMNGSTAERVSQAGQFRTQLFIHLEALDTKRLPPSIPRQSTVLSLFPTNTSSTSMKAPSSVSSSSDGEFSDPPTVKSVPVRLWGVTFSGERSAQSLLSFLTRVDELRVARRVSQKTLLHSGIDLFTGKALIWYRAHKKDFLSWDHLVQGLKKDFLPWDYEHQLFDEIKARTQGEDESISIYLAVMNNLFDRLSTPITNENKLRILMKNIDPFYQPYLAFTTINTVPELQTHCEKLENRRDAAKSFVRPSASTSVLEADLAYVRVSNPASSFSTTMANSVQSADQVTANPGKCFYCQAPGHMRRDCPRRRVDLRCHGCGAPGVIRPNCTACNQGRNSNQGNGRRRQ